MAKNRNIGKSKFLSRYDSDKKTEEYLDALKHQEQEYQKEKEGRRTIHVSSGDKNSLGKFSSGWNDFKSVLLPKYFLETRKAGKTKADEIAKYWNLRGYKTASGCNWSPKLVNMAKDEVGIKHPYEIKDII